jgi:hypothetical protein
MMKSIIFISSVSEGYEHIRQAAREAIAKAGGKPVGFEDFSALNKTSRNACLDGVRDCDVYVGILGARYGWVTPNGLSATEEEFKEAVQSGKRRLIFIEKVSQREEKQEAFVKRAGDYQTGRFWNKFKTTEELKENLEKALKEVFGGLMKAFSEEELKARLKQEAIQSLDTHNDQCWLVTASMPDFQALLTDDTSFNHEKLTKQVFLLGHEGDPPVFEIEAAKSKRLEKDHWLLEQTGRQNWREGLRLSIVRLYLDACVVVGMNVTGQEQESSDHLCDILYVYPEAIETIADAQLSFLGRVYGHFDPHLRWDRIALMSALHNIGHRNFTKPKPGQTSHPMSMRSDKGPFLASDTPRTLERNQLQQPGYGRSLRASFERILK